MDTEPTKNDDLERLRALADSLDCMIGEDFRLLTDTTEETERNWRKRGHGPTYILVGNRYLYPRSAVAEFLQTQVRQRRTVPAKDKL